MTECFQINLVERLARGYLLSKPNRRLAPQRFPADWSTWIAWQLGTMLSRRDAQPLDLLGFGVLYCLMWLYNLSHAYSSLVHLYGLPRASWWNVFKSLAAGPILSPSRLWTAFNCIFSYLLTTYGFALAYIAFSLQDPLAFSREPLDLVTAVYFSVVTIATVGYGDIVPVSTAARLAVATEVLVGVAYMVFFFALLAAELAVRRRPS